MPQIGHEIDGGPHVELRELVLRHERLLGKCARLDVGDGHDDALRRSLKRHGLRAFSHDDAAEHPSVIRDDLRHLVVTAHERTRVDQVREHVAEVGPMRARQFGTDFRAHPMKHVAGAAGPGIHLAAMGEIGGGERLVVELFPPAFEFGLAVGRRGPHRAPDLGQSREDSAVSRLGESPDGKRGEVVARYVLPLDRIEQGKRPLRAGRERGDRGLPVSLWKCLVPH